MKFLVDESTGMAAAVFLRSCGYDTAFASEDTPGVDDTIILSRASKEKRVLITNDKDFGELVFKNKLAHHGVLLLRLQDDSPANRVKILKIVLKKYAGKLENRFAVVTEKEIRIRSFPKI